MKLLEIMKFVSSVAFFAIVSLLYKIAALLVYILAGVPFGRTLMNQKKQLMKIPYITREEVEYIVNILAWPF